MVYTDPMEFWNSDRMRICTKDLRIFISDDNRGATARKVQKVSGALMYSSYFKKKKIYLSIIIKYYAPYGETLKIYSWEQGARV